MEETEGNSDINKSNRKGELLWKENYPSLEISKTQSDKNKMNSKTRTQWVLLKTNKKFKVTTIIEEEEALRDEGGE